MYTMMIENEYGPMNDRSRQTFDDRDAAVLAGWKLAMKELAAGCRLTACVKNEDGRTVLSVDVRGGEDVRLIRTSVLFDYTSIDSFASEAKANKVAATTMESSMDWQARAVYLGGVA